MTGPVKHLQEIILLSNEDYYRKMVNEVQDYAIIFLDTDGIIKNWNKGAERIKGYSSDEIIGRHIRVFYPEKDCDRGLPDKLLHEAINKGRTSTEGWRIRKDGTRFWASIVITALHDDDGKHIGFTKITRDLTKQKESQLKLEQFAKRLAQKNEELRRSEERYHKMVEEVVDYAIFSLSKDGIVKNWNQGAERIKGYSEDEIVGRNFRIFYTDEDLRKNLPKKNLINAAKHGKITTEGWRVRKDGSTFWASVVITALHDHEGNVIGFSKITKDLTDRKLIDDVRQLAQKNKELEQLVYITSHDLQEPLSSIKGFANILEHQYQGQLDDDADKYLHYMTESCTRMSNLIKSLLDYSLIGRERKLEKIDCNELVDTVVTDLSESIKAHQAKITIDDLPVLNANSVELELLFQNLIANAIKFRRKDVSPNITVKAKKYDDKWEFSVSDNGIGIDEKYREKIFNIFQRLHTRSEFEGTGIGLSHCKKIVSLYGGEIWVDSHPNQGSTFHFTIPQ